MSILIKIRNIVYILRIFYWLAFKAVVKAYWRGSVHQYTFHYHSAQEIWAKELVALFRTKIYKCKDSKDVRKDKTIILSNHRSQADFWIHNICAEYSCNFLARLAVGVVFFVFGIFGNKTVWFFNRSSKITPEKFNEWLNYKFSTSPRKTLLVYPQGHRMQGTVKVNKDTIKTGMLRVHPLAIQYAYREQIPVQILMSFGNEFVFNQKKLHIGWDQKIYYSFSKVYDPADFQDEKTFVLKMKDQFCDYFDKIWEIYSEGGQAQEVQSMRNLTA